MHETPAEEPSEDASPASERVGDPLRSAVERTLAATAGSASGTGRRARDLLDEIVRRGDAARDEIVRRGDAARDEIARRGDAARQGVARRREAAREEVTKRGGAAREEVARVSDEATNRLADAVADLRQASREDLGMISDRIGAVEGRLADLERALRSAGSGEGGGSGKSHEQGSQEPHPHPRVEGEGRASGADRGG